MLSVVEDTYTGDRSTIPSSLIIGCDGANSRVRKGSGITVDAEESGGPREENTLVATDGYSRDDDDNTLQR